MVTITLVKPVTCKRCKGSGNVQARRVHLGIPGTCFDCDGRGRVEGDAATLAAREAARMERVAEWEAWKVWEAEHKAAGAADVLEGARALEALEPARYTKLRTAIRAGHPGVDAALLTYLAQAKAALTAQG